MLRTIDHVYYWVSDMDRAVKFYEEILGLPLARRDGETWAEFDAGPIRLNLHQGVEGWPPQPGGATAVFRVDDLEAARSELEGRGVEFGHAAEVGEYARYATFSDPDGNTLQLIEYRKAGTS
jgi:predicted enzyme related to lactoylglutathione lyase